MIFPCVRRANTKNTNTKYTNTKYTNTVYDEVPERSSKWFIYEKRIDQIDERRVKVSGSMFSGSPT